MTLSQSSVMKLYKSVIEDTIATSREAFLDEGMDEQVLLELKQLWETKLLNSKAVIIETPPDQDGASTSGVRKNQPMKRNNESTVSQANTASNVMNQKVLTSGQVMPTVANQQQQGLMKSVSMTQTIKQQMPQQQTVQNGSTIVTTGSAPPQSTVNQQQNMFFNMLDPTKIVPIQITLPPQAGIHESQGRVLTIQVPATALQGNQLQQVLTGPVISATMGLPQPQASNLLQQHVNAALQGQNSPLLAKAIPQIDGQNDSIPDGVTIQISSKLDIPDILSILHDSRAGKSKKLRKKSKANNKRVRNSEVPQLDGLAFETGLLDDTSDEEDDVSEDPSEDDEIEDDKEEEDPDIDSGGMEEEPLNSEDDVSEEDPSDLFDTDNVVVCQYDKINRSRNKWKFYLKDGIMNLNGKDFVFQKVTGDAEW